MAQSPKSGCFFFNQVTECHSICIGRKEKLWKQGDNNANTSWRACLLASQQPSAGKISPAQPTSAPPSPPKSNKLPAPLKPSCLFPPASKSLTHSHAGGRRRCACGGSALATGAAFLRPGETGSWCTQRRPDDSSTHWSPSFYSQAGKEATRLLNRVFFIQPKHREYIISTSDGTKNCWDMSQEYPLVQRVT